MPTISPARSTPRRSSSACADRSTSPGRIRPRRRARKASRSTAAPASGRRPRASRSSDGWRRSFRVGRSPTRRSTACSAVPGRPSSAPACAAAIGRRAWSRLPSTIRDAAPSAASNLRVRCKATGIVSVTISWLNCSSRASMHGRAGPIRCRKAVFRSSMPRATSTSIASSKWRRRMPGPVLWCGSGGLAGALARGHRADAPNRLKRPVLGLFGSDQPATAPQLAACGEATIALGRRRGGRSAFNASWPTTAWRWSSSRSPPA